MSEVIAVATAFPAVVWTVLVLISVGFWLFTAVLGLGADGFEAEFDLDAGATSAVDAAGGTASLLGLVGALGLNRAPLTIVTTLIALFGWLPTMLVVQVLGSDVSTPVGIAVLALSAPIALVAAGRVARPIGSLYDPNRGTGHGELIGRICTVRTKRVNDRFGQANVDDATGAPHLVQVRYPEPNDLTRGSRALIVDVDDGVFRIDPDLDGLE